MNVICQISPEHRRVYIYRDSNLIGFVKQKPGEDDPRIILLGGVDGASFLTFNDIAIIQDNWNFLVESLQTTNTETIVI